MYKAILSYCLRCRKKTEPKNPNDAKTSKGKPLFLFDKMRVVFGSKKLMIIKKRDASRLLSTLALKAPVSNIPPPIRWYFALKV